jgi:hypothetical protein
MATVAKAKRLAVGSYAQSKNTSQQNVRTTLGEPIVALADKVGPIIRYPSRLYTAASRILNDSLANYQIRVHKREHLCL